MRRIVVLCAAVFLFCLYATEGRATTVVRLTPEEQVADADAIALGRCTLIESRMVDGQVQTYVTFSVSEVLKGPISAGRLVIRQVGGKVGDFSQWVEGSPRFDVGGEYVVFLASNGDGAYVVSGLFFGNFVVSPDASGRVWLTRDAGDGVLILPREDVSASKLADRIALDDLRRVVATRSHAPAKRDGQPAAQVPAEYVFPFAGPREFTSNFVLFNNNRWFEPDSGQAVQFWCNPDNFQPGGLNQPSLPSAVADALASWSSVSGSSFRAQFMGTESGGCGWRRDGVSRVSIDCTNQVAGESCRSIIAIGGANSVDGSQRVTVNGVSFSRTLEGDVCLNDGFCDLFVNPNYLRYILAHELGHCFGFNHSPVTTATMYGAFSYANAARGAALDPDDMAGLRFVYPGSDTGGGGGNEESEPPVIMTESVVPGTVNAGYSQTLTVDKGKAPFAWSLESGTLPPGVALSSEGVLSGVPSASGAFAFAVRVTDSLQRTAVKQLALQVRVPPPVVLAAEYRKNKRTLTFVGQNFAAGAAVTVNGLQVDPARLQYQTANSVMEIVAKGGRKKLNLNKGVGSNEVVITVEGVTSTAYRF